MKPYMLHSHPERGLLKQATDFYLHVLAGMGSPKGFQAAIYNTVGQLGQGEGEIADCPRITCDLPCERGS